MAEEKEYLHIPGHVPVREAAALLDVGDDRILEFINTGRLTAHKVEGRYMVSLESIQNFQKKPHGRTREKPVKWRSYRAGAKVYALEIELQAIPEQREELQTKLQTSLEEQKHLFPGTMLRYVFANRENPQAITILLIWKNTELTDEAALARDLETFKAEFADVLDWQTARYTTKLALIHT